MNTLHTAPSKVVLLTGASSGIGEATARWSGASTRGGMKLPPLAALKQAGKSSIFHLRHF